MIQFPYGMSSTSMSVLTMPERSDGDPRAETIAYHDSLLSGYCSKLYQSNLDYPRRHRHDCAGHIASISLHCLSAARQCPLFSACTWGLLRWRPMCPRPGKGLCKFCLGYKLQTPHLCVHSCCSSRKDTSSATRWFASRRASCKCICDTILLYCASQEV